MRLQGEKNKTGGPSTGTSWVIERVNAVNASKTIFRRPVVTRSISSDEGLRCVDIFRRKDNSFGFEEYRKDPEANEVGLK